MAIDVVLPELGESITSAKVATWLKREGDRVLAGEPIAEVETDKTNVELEAPESGVLLKIHVQAGTEDVAVGTLLATIERDTSQLAPPTVRHEVATRAPAGGTAVGDSRILIGGVIRRLAPETHAPISAAGSDIDATPLARRMAAVAGVDLIDIPMIEPGARIGKADIERVLRERAIVAAAQGRASVDMLPTSMRSDARFTERALSPMQRVAATRLVHAKQTTPHFYLRVECGVDALFKSRAA
jgi:pyruvate dehydrogenase E2 component (dihydrolipoyllysine-residue acetyltransferase)